MFRALLLALILTSSPASARSNKVTYEVKSLGLSAEVYSNWMATVQNGALHATDKVNVVQLARGPGETVGATAKAIKTKMQPDTWNSVSSWTVLGQKASRYRYSKKLQGHVFHGIFVIFQVAPKKIVYLSAATTVGTFDKANESTVKDIVDSIRQLGQKKSPPKPAPPKPKVDLGIGKGDKAPDFTLPTLTGAKTTLSGIRERVVLLSFWATWHKYSIKWMHMLTADKALTGHKQVRPLFTIVTDPRQKRTMKPFIKGKKWNEDLFLVDMLGKVHSSWAYDKKVPVFYVIAKGKVVGVVRGKYTEESHATLRKLVKAALR